MKKITLLLLLPFATASITSGFAADRGTPAEAQAMLQKAVAHYKAVGRKQALADFTTKKAPFGDRDLYVVCIGPDHTVTANGGFPPVRRSVGRCGERYRREVGRPARAGHCFQQGSRRGPVSLDQSGHSQTGA